MTNLLKHAATIALLTIFALAFAALVIFEERTVIGFVWGN